MEKRMFYMIKHVLNELFSSDRERATKKIKYRRISLPPDSVPKIAKYRATRLQILNRASEIFLILRYFGLQRY